jgi:nucleotide-binding universal stress UspA family protein
VEVIGMKARQAPDAAASSDGGKGSCVIVGVDGSESSSAALAWAAQEARLRGATLKVVYAWHVPPVNYGDFGPVAGVDELGEEATGSVSKQVVEVLGSDPGLAVLEEIREGPPAKAIVEAASDACLVVVGSRGRGGFSGLLLGSVSAAVARHAPCPVTVVRS